MVGAVKCPICGKASTQYCNGCNKPFCTLHEYRHPDCAEGR
jgi:endogenous inhibitor of DNA gyrase (YacG/DUF329 family)